MLKAAVVRGSPMNNRQYTGNDDFVFPEPYYVYEKIAFEWCLLRLNSRWISRKERNACISRMRSMTLKRRSLISVAMGEMARSPRLAHDCLVYLLTLPDEILESDPYIRIRLLALSNTPNVRTEIESCLKYVTVCFLEAIGSERDSKEPLINTWSKCTASAKK